MSILLGIGITATITVLYLGKKGWQMLHKVVGITPGVLTYQDPNAPLLLSDMTWQQLTLNVQHLSGLSDSQLRQLQRIDAKVATYYNYQQVRQAQNITPAVNEAQFVLHKLLYARLPEMLASHYHLLNIIDNPKVNTANKTQCIEAGQLLQDALDSIERRVDTELMQIETQHLQDLRVMKRYVDSHKN
ncbi:hypothetical protein [Psychrobacter sp. CAL346-MNA-CIBAN-0220]|uniref:hypothetical protein n=1 Tax=Psychrobacter sp. CAL346-MNA-CIBAN-0220 TaxID=3140457 RepID=UPI00332146FF